MPPYNLFWCAHSSLQASRETQMVTSSCQSCGCSLLPNDFTGISVLGCCKVSFNEYLYPQENSSRGKICWALWVILVDEVVSLKNIFHSDMEGLFLYFFLFWGTHTPPLVQSGIQVLQLNGNILLLFVSVKGLWTWFLLETSVSCCKTRMLPASCMNFTRAFLIAFAYHSPYEMIIGLSLY